MIEITEFTVEDVDIQSLNGGIKKKFTSLATNGTLFRWRFGDTHQNPIIETTENPYYHTFKEKGIYNVSHQSCYPCGLTLTCSPEWCTQVITVETPPKPSILPLVATAGFFFLIFPKKECRDYDNKKDCRKHNDCQWLEKENECVKKCAEGYKLKRIRTNRHKRPYKYKCTL